MRTLGEQGGRGPVTFALGWAGAVLSVLVAHGCSGPPHAGVRHPSEALLALPGPPADVLDLREPGPPSPSGIASASVLTRIGRLEGPAEEVFGAITDLVTDHHGRLLLLDAQSHSIRLFDSGGRFLQEVGGFGRGPGEFVEPRFMVLLPTGELIVAEAVGRLHRFLLTSDSIRFVAHLSFPGDLWDGCALGDRLYIHGMRPGDAGAIHVLSLEGDLVSSFAEVYPTSNPIIRHHLSQGHIACLEGAGLVLHAPENLPQLRAYDATGVLRWWLEMEGFQPLPVYETPTGGAMRTAPEGPWHMSLSLVEAPSRSQAALQVLEVVPDRASAEGWSRRLHTFLLSTEGPGALYVGDGWSRIVGTDNDRVFAVVERPHPELLVHPFALFPAGTGGP
jgi:hypothetical protein